MKILIFNLIIILFLTFNVNYIQEKKIIINEQIINIENLNNSQLINFDNKLDKNYIPNNLIKINDLYFNEDLYNNYLNMIKNINNNENIQIVSGYRSYEYQNQLFNNETKDKLYSVMPAGTSEHQSGLAIDISINILDYLLESDLDESNTYNWLLNNSYKYGFIIRYKKDKIKYTNVIYEPWHLRYVDPIIANLLYDKNWCLEELYEFLKNNKIKYEYKNKLYLIYWENNILKQGEIKIYFY